MLNRRTRRSLLYLLLAMLSASGVVVGMFGACAASYVPDQSKFEAIDAFRARDEAGVRLYAATVPWTAGTAIHAWFVVKHHGSRDIDRWEVWQTAGGPHGHVRHNLMGPTRDVGAGGVHVLAELRGAEAERVIEFIETQSPGYPARQKYHYVPGPNSNSYVQWVLTGSRWEVSLPPTAVGKGAKWE